MADIGVGSALGDTRRHRQHRLLPVQRLDLRFLVYTQDDSPVWRGHVQPDDILHLVYKQRIGGQLERLAPVRLQAERSPDPADGGVRQARLGRHAADRPMGGILRRGVQRSLDHLEPPARPITVRGRPGRYSSVSPSIRSFTNRLRHLPTVCSCDAKSLGDFLALKTLRTEQDHPATVRERSRRLVPTNLRLEKAPLLRAQYNRICQSFRHRPHPMSINMGHIQ